jgi:hypothetical protein
MELKDVIETLQNSQNNKSLEDVKSQIIEHKYIFDFEKIYYLAKSEPIKKYCLEALNHLKKFGCLNVFKNYSMKENEKLRDYFRELLISGFKTIKENKE